MGQNGRNSASANPNILSVLTDELAKDIMEENNNGNINSSSIGKSSTSTVMEGTRLGFILASLTSRHLDLCKILADKQWEEYLAYRNSKYGEDDEEEGGNEIDKFESSDESNSEKSSSMKKN